MLSSLKGGWTEVWAPIHRVESVFRAQAQDLKAHRAPENDISSREDSRHTTECEEREMELGVGGSVSKGLVLQAQDLSLMDLDPYKNAGHGGTSSQFQH